MPIAAGNSFVTFGPAHLAAMAVTVVLAAALPAWARRAGESKAVRGVGVALGLILVTNELVYYAHGLATVSLGDFVRDKLPLHVCDVAVYLIAWTLWKRNGRLFEVAYFWGLGGTLQAVLTPNILEGFPSYEFIRFFINHCGIVVAVLYAVLALRMRPRKGCVLRLIVITNLYMLFVAGVNRLVGSNYMFLCKPPAGQSPFFFLPWPWYIVFIELVGVAFVVLLYLPFAVGDRIRRRKAAALSRSSV
ncbi:MAG: TIGR02206 family membrane protein [Phycisphaerae bacterium]